MPMIAAEKKEDVYRACYGKVRAYVAQKLGNAQEAEDLVSEIFLKVYEKLDTFDETRASVSTWVYSIARNAVIDYYRTRRPTEPLPEALAAQQDMERELLHKDALQDLSRALQQLDTRARDIVILRYYNGLPLKTIALRLGLSYSHTKLLHQAALTRLRRLLQTE